MTMNTENGTAPRAEHAETRSARRFRVGDTVLYKERVHTVVETRLNGTVIETLDRSRHQVFVSASTELTSAP